MNDQSVDAGSNALLGDLAAYDAAVNANQTGAEVDALLRRHIAWPGVVVYDDDGTWLGTIPRGTFEHSMSTRFHRELFEHRPMSLWLERLGHQTLALDADVRVCDAVSQALTRPVHRRFEPIVVLRADGPPRLVDCQDLLMHQNALLRMQMQAYQETAEALRLAEEKFRGIFEHAIEGIFQSTPEGQVLSANPSLARILGYASPQDMLREDVAMARGFYRNEADRQRLVESLQRDGVVRGFQTEFARLDGRPIWVSINARLIADEHDQPVFEGTIEDITEQKRMARQLEADARQDALTGLDNRVALTERLARAVEEQRADPRRAYVLMFLDFDRFKLINDSLGHHMGDEFLREVAQRLTGKLKVEGCGCVSEMAVHVARLGGDEFTVLLQGPDVIDRCGHVADCLLQLLAAGYELGGHMINSSASIGIVTSEFGHATAEDVLRDADIAMYAAKERGKACAVVFSRQMRDEAREHSELSNDLRHAVEGDQLDLWFQPIVSVEDGQLIGFESLLRWSHPRRGIVSPAQFIPIAEETGMIRPIGWWVLDAACRQILRWQARPDLIVSVNLSKRQLLEPGFVQQAAELIRGYDFDPSRLKLEVTESTVTEGGDRVLELLQQLRDDVGLELWMDDFGTGASSLSCLHHFPLSAVKLDRQFIQSMDRCVSYAAITQAVVTLAHNLKLQVIAEGIESAGQMAQLLTLECDLVQGYLFSPPVTAERATLICQAGQPLWSGGPTSDPLIA